MHDSPAVGTVPSPQALRASETRAVTDLLERTIQGQPGIAWIEGEAGIGKTMLFEQVVAAATASAFRVLRCRPVEAEAGSVFLGLADTLGPVDDEALASLPDPQRRALDAALLRSSEPAGGWHAAAAGFASLLRAMAAHQPVLVAIDDAHWLDEPSARVIAFVARRIVTDPITFVFTSRPSNANALAVLARDAADRFVRVDVGPLSVGAIHRVLTQRLGVTLTRPQLLRLHEATGGNPLFAIEFVRSQHPGAHPDFDRIPSSLQPLLARSIEGLSAAATEVVRLAALMARPTVALVRRAASLGPAAGLTEAERTGILDEHGEVITFRHPLLAGATLALVTPAERRALHASLSTLVADPVERARHLVGAADGPDAAAAALVESAGDLAIARGALNAGAALFEHAANLSPTEDVRRSLRLHYAGAYFSSSGETERGEPLMERALEIAPAGERRAACAESLGTTRGHLGNLAEVDRLFRLAQQEELSDDWRAVSLITFARWAQMYDLETSVEQARRACEVAARTQNDGLIAAAEAILIAADFQRGTPVDMARARTLATKPSDLAASVRASDVVLELLIWTDQLAEARAIIDADLVNSNKAGDVLQVLSCTEMLAEIDCRAGNFSSAYRGATEGLELIADLSQIKAGSVGFLAAQAVASAAMGNDDAAAASARDALELVEQIDVQERTASLRASVGFARLVSGDFTGAAAHLREAHRIATSLGLVHPGVIPYRADLAEALLGTGDLDEAERIAQALEQDGTRLDHPRAIATGARATGMVLVARGDLEGAGDAYRRALTAHERVPSAFEHGRTLLAAGILERRLKRKKEARGSLSRALEIFTAADCVPLIERTTDEVARISGRAPSSGDLTNTERRIAELVADGLTNVEVAERLFVGVRTVESHLTRIYRKVGVRSRTELATKLRA